jgi:hypothetical protein
MLDFYYQALLKERVKKNNTLNMSHGHFIDKMKGKFWEWK